MKAHPNLILLAFLFLMINSAHAQLEYLRLSPAQRLEQRVGMTDVTVEYSRPQLKGRTIFGGLVPFGKMWRTGANENTKITFSHRVRIGERDIPAGSYALFTKPMKESWEIYFYTSTDNFDIPNPIDTSNLIYLTRVESKPLEELQSTLTINLYDLKEDSASLGISWERTAVRIPISFYTREAMEGFISRELERNALDYSIAASYYFERGIELEKAKMFQELSIASREQPSAWSYNTYGQILYQLGDQGKAVEAIEYSLQLAREAENSYLMEENEKLLQRWAVEKD